MAGKQVLVQQKTKHSSRLAGRVDSTKTLTSGRLGRVGTWEKWAPIRVGTLGGEEWELEKSGHWEDWALRKLGTRKSGH